MSAQNLDVFLKFLFLQPGGAFRCPQRFPSDPKPKNRYFFILNRDPERDEEIVLVTPTTQGQRRREARGKAGEASIVDLSPQEYSALEVPSTVDCNSAEVWTKAELGRRIAAREASILDPLPETMLKRLREAVLCSRLIEPRIKRLVLGEDVF